MYFEATRGHFGLTTAEVVVADKTKGSAPSSVVDYAHERAREPGGYDHIFCVFDKNGHESFDRARTKIHELANRARNPMPIHEAISVPCFEIWVLLHFEKTDAPFQSCDDVAARIQRQHMDEYEKANPNIAKQLMARIEVAIANSAWLASRTGIINNNPSTSVHRLVQHLQTVGASTTRASMSPVTLLDK